MQQHTANAEALFSSEIRQSTLNRIYQSIHHTVKSTGRGEEAAQKYAQNIEVCS